MGTRSELEQLNQEWNRAWLDGDVSAVDALMDPGFTYEVANIDDAEGPRR